MPAEIQSEKLHELFIQNVSHELKTPLAVMLGFTQMLREGEFGVLAPEQEEATTIILDRTEALRSIVERICLLIGVEGQENLQKPVSLDEIVRDEIIKKKALIDSQSMSLIVDYADNLPQIYGDQYQLSHMIDCLLDNAIKFNKPNGRINIQLYTEKDRLCVSFKDSGNGLSSEEIEQISSNQFYQVDGSMTRHYGGLGLGLTLVKSVLKEHNGTLEIHGLPGVGSQFIIKLPTDIPGIILPEPQTLRRKYRILVVDDEENVGLIVQKGLKKLPNSQIQRAVSAEEALAHCQEAPFDLIITDYMMPGIDGIALAAQIRQLYPQTVILMLTAHNDEQLHQHASQVSVQRILNKPIEIAKIRQAVSQALQETNPT